MRAVTKQTHNYLNQLKKRLQELNKSTVEVGYFPSQQHYSGLSMAGLFAIHSGGAPSVGIPARPAMEIALMFNPVNKNITIKRDLSKYFSKISHKYPPIRFTQLLENVGGDYVDKIRAVFGDTSKLDSNSFWTQQAKKSAGVVPSNNPLVWTGSLRDALSYSINGWQIVTP